MSDSELQARIKKQLLETGITRYSLLKNEARYLHRVIHSDEQIGAAVNGRTTVGPVMLVATDRRVIFLDCKSFYTTVDELTYDVVSGVSRHVQGLFANVILHTRIGDYNLRLVNVRQAQKFVEFIESKRLENPMGYSIPGLSGQAVKPKAKVATPIGKKERQFLDTHNVGVLSSISRTGNVDGAVIYYTFDQDYIYFLTKSETNKARNLLVYNQVALTIYEELSYQILQISGVAEVVNDVEQRNRVVDIILKNRNLEDGTTMPPVTKISEGGYVVFRITITDARYSDYKK